MYLGKGGKVKGGTQSNLVNFGQIWSTVVKFWSNFGQILIKFGQILLKFGQIWSNLVKFGKFSQIW